jgi:MinD superfamily P-loop ATPase
MTTICVASGKGGAGKTSFTAALASTIASGLAYRTDSDSGSGTSANHTPNTASDRSMSQNTLCIFADCDVDAANGAIALGATLEVSEPYFAGPGFLVDPSACTGCGSCFTACRFGAIKPVTNKNEFSIVPELCERCGACVDHCPTKAIGTYEKEAGVLLESSTRWGIRLVHARLEPGEETSGKLVNLVRRRATQLAHADSVILVDAPPGIGCPVIASIAGTDLVVVIVAASVSGIRDASRLVCLAASMKRHCVAVLNKTGLDPRMDIKAKTMLADQGIPLAGEIPFDPGLRSAEESHQTWASIESDSSTRIKAALSAIRAIITSIGSKNLKEEDKHQATSHREYQEDRTKERV